MPVGSFLSPSKGPNRAGRSSVHAQNLKLLSFTERETGLEPAASSLARRRSTTELLPHQDTYFGVGERRFELLRLSALVPKTSVSAIPPLARLPA